jgi:putative ABC transport system ATP-binding protein
MVMFMFLKTFNVKKHFGEVKAVDGVSLEIEKGEFVSIMGPSGSGKTTLLTLLGTLDSLTSGDIIIDDENLSSIKDVDTFRSKKIGFIFQFHNLVGYLTALENVELPLHGLMPIDKRKAKASELLDLVGLKDRMHHIPSQLSGGERQRVAIARALVNDPLLVLADEPTGELDSSTTQKIMDLMKKINQEKNITFLVVTHDPEVAKKTGKIIILRDGKISREELVKSASIEDIMTLKNSTLGQQLIQGESGDPYLEKLGLFKERKLTREGELLLSLFEKVENL